MANPFKIQINSVRIGIAEETKKEVAELVQLITCPVRFLEHVQSERLPDETIKQTYERVETALEDKTGQRHYGSYESFRVQKHRIQTNKNKSSQPTLFD